LVFLIRPALSYERDVSAPQGILNNVTIEKAAGSLSSLHTEFTEQLAERARTTEKVLFEGRWVSLHEAERGYRRLKWRSRLKLVELLVLFVFMAIATLVPLIVLQVLGAIVA